MKVQLLALLWLSSIIASAWATKGYEWCRCCPCPCECNCEVEGQHCDDQLDICLVVDGSISIAPFEYELQLKFITNVMKNFVIGPNNVLTYGVDAIGIGKILWQWDDPVNADNDAFNIMGFSSGFLTTGLSDALNLCANTSFVTDRPDVKNVAIVISDGLNNSQRPMEDAISSLKSVATIYVVGVGLGMNPEKLSAISSDGTFYNVPVFEDLLNQVLMDHMMGEFCEPPEVSCECCCPEPKYPFWKW